ncbi:recombinase family protein [Brevundimonas naejangsanensis]|uniref:recombinase family protein n=1 Tax=Brevundimonas naejangsanensis TaxID=588932 RepID=UPI00040CF130|nr:recombinase family protein [Brevundimonas naejangsanensis]
MEAQFSKPRARSYRQAAGLFDGFAELAEESAAESVVRKDAVIYVRLPSDEGGTGAGLTDQIDACSLLCAERSWNIADVVVDEAVRTAADPHGINLALYAQADVVVVYDLAVLTSSTNLLLWLIDDLQQRNIELAVAANRSDLAEAFSDQAVFDDILKNNPTAMGMIGDIEDLRGDLTDFVAIEDDLESRDELIWLVTNEPITAARLADEISALHHA